MGPHRAGARSSSPPRFARARNRAPPRPRRSRSLILALALVAHAPRGRRAQVCALAQLLLEPHYRTIEGFATLVEKDWCAFGHKFSERCGHGTEHKRDERSPIFVQARARARRRSSSARAPSSSARAPSSSARSESDAPSLAFQWLDAVHQLVEQFPRAFEFDGRLLAFLADALHSCLFGTFLADCELERERDARARERTESVWTYVFDRRAAFAAWPPGGFAPDDAALWPVTAVKRLRLWEQYYCRWDADFHPLAAPATASTALVGATATATPAAVSAWEPDFGDSPKASQRTSRDAPSSASGDGLQDEPVMDVSRPSEVDYYGVRSIRKSMDEVRI